MVAVGKADTAYSFPPQRPQSSADEVAERLGAPECELILGPKDRGTLPVDLAISQEEAESGASPAPASRDPLGPGVHVVQRTRQLARVPGAQMAVELVLALQVGWVCRECVSIDHVSQLAGEGEEIEQVRHG